jgi:hypothetical protein
VRFLAAIASLTNNPHWTYQLHYDNLRALVKADENLGPLPDPRRRGHNGHQAAEMNFRPNGVLVKFHLGRFCFDQTSDLQTEIVHDPAMLATQLDRLQ